MLAIIYFVLQIIGIIAFGLGIWYNLHLRQAENPQLETLRAFFHRAQRRGGESDIMKMALAAAAVAAFVFYDYRIFAATLGGVVVVGAIMSVAERCQALFARFA